jgi:hypothetical protein
MGKIEEKKQKTTKEDENKNMTEEEAMQNEVKCLTSWNIPICSHMSKMRLFPLLYSISLCRLLPPRPLPVTKAQDFPPQNLLSGSLS